MISFIIDLLVLLALLICSVALFKEIVTGVIFAVIIMSFYLWLVQKSK